jgi:hypothetical protein
MGQIGPQPISLHDLWAYCELSRTTPDDREFLLNVIPDMDAIFIQHFHEEAEKKARKNTPKTKGARR